MSYVQTPERGETTSRTSEGAFSPTKPPKSAVTCFFHVLFSTSTVRDPPAALAGLSTSWEKENTTLRITLYLLRAGGLSDTRPPTLTSSGNKQPNTYTFSGAGRSAETRREQAPSTPRAGAPWRKGRPLGPSRAALAPQTAAVAWHERRGRGGAVQPTHGTDVTSSTRLLTLPCRRPPAPRAAERQPPCARRRVGSVQQDRVLPVRPRGVKCRRLLQERPAPARCRWDTHPRAEKVPQSSVHSAKLSYKTD